MSSTLSRRDFLKVSAVAGGGVLIGIGLPSYARGSAKSLGSSALAPSVYVRIDPAGTVTVTAFRTEMGQGIRTGIAMIIAEELDADWASVRIEQADAGRAYGDQLTGGSVSISDHYTDLRRAGAVARAMLVQAAADRWGVSPSSCRTDSGWVINPGGGARLSYGELADAASRLPVPDPARVQLKSPREFRIIGSPTPLYDTPAIVTGKARYAMDMTVPGMLYAVIARPPTLGSVVNAVDSGEAKRVPGVRDVIQISGGVAVVADNTWAAIRGRAALKVSWTPGRTGISSQSIRRSLPRPAASRGRKLMRASYHLPFYAHAQMEPMCCVADVRSNRCEIWAPTQDPQAAVATAAWSASLQDDSIKVHVPLLGGRFGRGLQTDFVEDAVELSKAIQAPVKLVWTREDDIGNDYFHPLTRVDVTGEPGKPSTISMNRVASRSVVPTGPWRAVENVALAFAHESFVDEMAAAKRTDPARLRLRTYPATARPCLRLAVKKSNWGKRMPSGWGRGIAYHSTWNATPVAQVAEVSVKGRAIRVHRVVCAVDCGTVINPDAVRAQIEGGITFALTAALKDAITIEQGRVKQGNFDDYRLLRFDEMPAVEVHIVPSSARPRGIGEMGVPPLAPALANAVFAATGKRLRSLPLKL